MRLSDFLPKNARKYSWTKIKKEYDKLGVPKEFWTPLTCPVNEILWHVIISLRKSGKTTNILLLIMVIHKLYGGCVGAYVREKEDMIAPKELRKLFETIKEFGYIEKLFEGKYNDVLYSAGCWYFIKKDENNTIVEQSEEFMHSLAVDLSETYKSSLNLPNVVIILFDEFISKRPVRSDSFPNFCDIIDTVSRYRKMVYVFMTANTLNPYALYLQELGISRTLRLMKLGEHKVIESGCVPVYTEIIKPNNYQRVDERKSNFNLFRFGFDNPKLNSITGLGTWNLKNYRHLPKLEESYKVQKKAVFELDDCYFMIELCTSKEIPPFIFIRPTRTDRHDCTIFTMNTGTGRNYKYGFGTDKFSNKIWNLIKVGQCYYATNESGIATKEYIERVINNQK